MDTLLPALVPHGSSNHSVLAQIAGSLGSALFVGIMGADVDRLMAADATKAAAYAAGFFHTLLIDIGVVAVALIGSVVFARIVGVRKKLGHRASAKE